MCGLLGVVGYQDQVSLENFRSALDLQFRRGPDFGGHERFDFSDYSIFLGHRRLSIIDLNSSANQPFSSSNGRYSIVFNGEIYNYKEIRSELESLGYTFISNSDTEVLLKAFELWQEDCLSKLVGMFAFAIIDLVSQELFIARDRAGVKPLYYSLLGKGFRFSSELKSLMNLHNFDGEISLSALKTYFRRGYIPAPESIYLSVKKLEAGTYLKYNLKTFELTLKRYWSVYDHLSKDKFKGSYREAKLELKELLISSVNYRTISDVPFGVFLSGGYDSSLVTALVQNSSNSVSTFTVGFEDSRFDESNYARTIANYLGTEHNEVFCTMQEAREIIEDLPLFYDEPFGDSSAIPTILVSRLAQQKVTVALSADGADELFAGYDKYSNAFRIAGYTGRVPHFARHLLGGLIKGSPVKLLSRLANRDLNPDLIHKFVLSLESSLSPSAVGSLMSRSYSDENVLDSLIKDSVNLGVVNNENRNLSELSIMLMEDFNSYLTDDILVKVDRATMSSSIEGREPLLDHRLIEFASNLPDEFKLRYGQKKYILKDIVHDYIPKAIMDRPKMGFGVPVKYWMREDLKDMLIGTLSQDNLKNIDFLDSGVILSLLRKYLDGDDSLFTLLWHIFIFVKWYDRWSKN